MASPLTRRWAYWGLIVLSAINMLNYIDRFLAPALLESIKASELQPNDILLGLLGSGFIVIYTLAAPIFGVLGDRRSRPRWIAIGIFLWSVATALSGMARSYLQLLISRALVGVGEAAYGTIAPSLLADYFSKRLRGRIFAIFFCAIPVGAALGYVFGGLLDKHFGWRAAFFVGGIPGIILAALTLFLRDPPRGSDERDYALPEKNKSIVETYRGFLANSPYIWTVLGYAAYTFAIGGLSWWMPSFLERVREIPRESATVSFGGIVVVTGLVGTFVGGWWGDHWAKTSRQAYLWLSALTMILAAPFAFVALSSSTPSIYYPALFIAELLAFISTGPINSAIVNFVAPAERASAVALSVFSIHMFGDVWSPSIIGTISHFTSLATAVLLVPIVMALSGVLWWIAGRSADRSS
ncbi:MAG TPA: MFS transporter [Steroidobacteraceae bacterium]|nr:MFS transporter [Steroidobacteraceae bacterium]